MKMKRKEKSGRESICAKIKCSGNNQNLKFSKYSMAPAAISLELVLLLEGMDHQTMQMGHCICNAWGQHALQFCIRGTFHEEQVDCLIKVDYYQPVHLMISEILATSAPSSNPPS